jgi:hypothetical protein
MILTFLYAKLKKNAKNNDFGLLYLYIIEKKRQK